MNVLLSLVLSLCLGALWVSGPAHATEERWFETVQPKRQANSRRPVNRAMDRKDPQESDSGIKGPKFLEIEQDLKNLATKYASFSSYATYGKTVLGRNLSVIRIGLPGRRPAAAPAVLLTGATHGDEYLGIEDQMPRIFLSKANEPGSGVHNFIKKGGMIYVVPIFNPDGYDARERTNTNGVDVNRDFDVIPTSTKKFTQIETKNFAEFLEQDLGVNNLTLKMTMDYHCCGNAWLYPWGYTKEVLAEPALTAHKEWAKGFLSLFGPTYKMGTTWSIFGYLSNGTSRDFYFAKYGSLSYTFEGAFGVENQNIVKHVTMWDQILNYFAGARFR